MDDAISPSVCFKKLQEEWKRRSSLTQRLKDIADIAFRKDAREILRSRPNRVAELLPSDFEDAQKISDLIEETSKFISGTLLPQLQPPRCLQTAVVSPLAGGDIMEAVDGSFHEPPSTFDLSMCCLNSGSLGFSGLSNESILWWRLWDMAAYGSEHGIQIFICPGFPLYFRWQANIELGFCRIIHLSGFLGLF